MVKRHIKRIAVPKTWPIVRKGSTFVTRPNPGSQKLKYGLPLNIVLRDMLHIADTAKEVRHILTNGAVLVDKKVRKSPRYLVGLLDTISIPKTNKHYRLLINQKGKLTLAEINEEESKLKLAKITGKTKLKSGKTQLNLSGSRNMLVEKDEYKRGYVLLLELPEQKIKDVFKFEKGATVYMIDGKHVGDVAKVESFTSRTITLKSKGSGVYETHRTHQIVVGKDKEAISIKYD